MSDDTTGIGVILEEIRDQNKAVLEAVGDIQQKVKGLPTRDEFQDLVSEVKTIKFALTETNHQVSNHKIRLTRLEQAG
ncbi:MAG TPA: hypothetical protein VLG13_02230 [Patescibacteria group bacterium]|nr:hypothetical protein [Patescibacteria group bacterium]